VVPARIRSMRPRSIAASTSSGKRAFTPPAPSFPSAPAGAAPRRRSGRPSPSEQRERSGRLWSTTRASKKRQQHEADSAGEVDEGAAQRTAYGEATPRLSSRHELDGRVSPPRGAKSAD